MAGYHRYQPGQLYSFQVLCPIQGNQCLSRADRYDHSVVLSANRGFHGFDRNQLGWARKSVTLGAIIIIVIFRNEIRTVLLARNLKFIFWGGASKTVTSTIEIIVQSILDMARRNCGALIVLPGKEGFGRGDPKRVFPGKGKFQKR